MEYNDLLDKNKVNKYLTENSNLIFGKNKNIQLQQIKRSETYNPEAFNILYDLIINGQKRSIRVSTSRAFSKEHDYRIFRYLFDNGFSQGAFLVPKPIVYLKKDNLFFYENTEGKKLTDLLNDNKDELNNIIIRCAKLCKRIHNLEKPNITLFDPTLLFENFQYELCAEKYPESKNLENIIQTIKNKLPKNVLFTLCHGDFNPNNILINKEKICLIDFGLTMVFYKEIDLASFIVHLRMMLEDNQSLFEELKTHLLNTYEDYDKNILHLLMALLDARLFEISIIYQNSNYNTNFLFKCLNNDLEKANIVLKNE